MYSLRMVNGWRKCFRAEFQEDLPEERGWELDFCRRISTGIPRGLGMREYFRWKEQQEQWYRGRKGQTRLETERK